SLIGLPVCNPADCEIRQLENSRQWSFVDGPKEWLPDSVSSRIRGAWLAEFGPHRRDWPGPARGIVGATFHWKGQSPMSGSKLHEHRQLSAASNRSPPNA